MQINTTNGTLTQIQETLTASSGYTLPNSINVSGATSNYNNLSGAITLTNLTTTMSITASAVSSQINNISVGTLKLAKAFIGNSEVASMWLGNVKVYEKGETPPAPTYTWACTVNNLGSQDPTNVSFTNDGTMPTFEEVVVDGDTFIKIPTMYRKVNSAVDNQITSFTIADGKIDNDYQPYPCFLDESGNLLPYILIGKYWSNSSSRMQSVSNTSPSSYAIGTARNYARNRGTGYLVYDWQIHQLWRDLIICAKRTINTNSGSGIGADNIDDLGIYWGTEANSSVDGLASDSGSIIFSYKPSAYVDSPTSSTTDYNTVNYTLSSSNGNITKLGYDSNHPFVNMPSSASGTSYTTYYCDGYTIGETNRQFNANVSYSSAYSGAFRSYFGDRWTTSHACRLCYRPIV